MLLFFLWLSISHSSSSLLSKWWMPSPLACGVGAVCEKGLGNPLKGRSTKISLMLWLLLVSSKRNVV